MHGGSSTRDGIGRGQAASVRRRSLLGAGVAALAASACAPRPRATGRVLRVMSWEGYTDEAWINAFRRRTQAEVQLTYVYSVDEVSAKMAASKGADYDVICIESSSFKRLADSGLIRPLDDRRLRISELLPVFQDVAGLSFAGRRYGAPYAWGSVPLIYAKAAFASPPNSWSALWDQSREGRVISLDDANNKIVTTALALGFRNPFHLSEAQFAQIRRQLLVEKRNLLTYFAGFDEGASVFAQGGVDLMAAMAEPQLAMIAERGVAAGLVIPREGAIGWIDCWAISAGARDPELAHQWIAGLMNAEVGGYLSRTHRYGNTTDQRANQEIGLDYAERLTFLQAPESFARRADLWNDVKATVVV